MSRRARTRAAETARSRALRFNEEAYWTELRKQFLIRADEVYLNNGTVGSCPMPVLRAVFDGYYDTEKMAQASPEDYPIWGYGAWNEILLVRLGDLPGVDGFA